MKRLGRLNSVGSLLVGERRFDDVEYDLNVWQRPNGTKLADGLLRADHNVLVSAIMAKGDDPARLELCGGGLVEIVLTNVQVPGDAKFAVSGPVPGF